MRTDASDAASFWRRAVYLLAAVEAARDVRQTASHLEIRQTGQHAIRCLWAHG